MGGKDLTRGRVAVLLGGTSGERDVSLVTGRAVLESLRRSGVDAFPLDTAQRSWMEEVRTADAAFVALHGRGGEDGTVQGLLDLLGIPYTGSGVLGSALAMDKAMAKRVLSFAGLPTPAWRELGPGHYDAPLTLPLPLVVKPNREGSTLGITVVREEKGLAPAIAGAVAHDPVVLLEAFAPGDDLTVGVLNGRPLAVVQIVTETGFYDYRTKYQTGAREYRSPDPLSPEATRRAREIAEASCRALRCAGGARVDLRGGEDGMTVLEVNTMPGMTPTSLLPKSAAGAGMDFDALVLAILQTAGEGSR